MKRISITYRDKGKDICTDIIKETYNDDEEWKEYRKNGIGASEVPTIIGLNNYQTLYQWWRIRKGLDPEQPHNEAMDRGHVMEDAVARYFEIKTGLKVNDNSANNDVYYHKDYPWRRVTPDRIGDLGKRTFDFSKRFLLECKTYRGYITDGDYPRKWRAQVMYQLGVTGCKVGYIAWVDSDLTLGFDKIEFVKEEFDSICNAVDSVWKYCIEGDVEPDAKTADDYKRKFPKHVDGKAVEFVLDMQENIENIQRLNEEIKALEEQRDALADIVKVALEDAEIATDAAGVQLCSYKASSSFNEAELKEKNPTLYNKYMVKVFDKTAFKKGEGDKAYKEFCTTTGSRVLRFPKKK